MLALVAGAAGVGAQQPVALPPSHLAVRINRTWVNWWQSAAPPAVWTHTDSLVTRDVNWHRGTSGIEYAEFELAGSGEAWRTRVVLVRIDPAALRFTLDTAFGTPFRGEWSVARTPAHAALALNAGQFVDAMPWGWVVMRGHQFLPPGSGPLAVAVIGDSSGSIHWMPADSAAIAPPPHTAWAFESYPELLRNDTVPAPLRARQRGVDVGHRDARLALGRLRDGRLLIALTRFDALGDALGMVPFGLTVPEMAALMGALGCRDAVLLDGGISAQLLVRDSAGIAHIWEGVRHVPLALIAFPH